MFSINLNGSNVPEAKVNLGDLNGSYRESRPTDFIDQGQRSAEAV